MATPISVTPAVNLPVRAFIEQFVADNFANIDFRQGTAFNDLFGNVMAALQQPYRHEINQLKISQSILNFDNMSSDDINALVGNFLVQRALGTNATGTVRVYFTTPGDYFLNTLVFMDTMGLQFFSMAPVTTSVSQLLANRNTDGTYYLDVLAQAALPGPQYSVQAGDITLVQNQPSQIASVTNLAAFSPAVQTESNAVLYDKVRRAIAVRNLVNDTSIQTVLFNQFGFIRDIYVAGAGDPAMVRDLLTINSSPSYQIHIGGYVDVYIDTTGITSYQLNINALPENLVVQAIPSATSTTIFSGDTGVIQGNIFYDPNQAFYINGVAQIISGNLLNTTETEFGEVVTTTYTIKQSSADNTLRISSGEKLNSLDGIYFPNSNFFTDFSSGNFIVDDGIAVGDYFVSNLFGYHSIDYVTPNLIELTPSNISRQSGVFNAAISFNGTSADFNYPGIGGTAGPTQTQTGDILFITTGSAWGQYTVLNVVSDDEIWVAQTPITQSITFGGTNVISAVDPSLIGQYIVIQSSLGGNPAATAFQIASTTTTTTNHSITGAHTVWISPLVPTQNVNVGDLFEIFVVPTKSTSVTVALSATIVTNARFATFATGANIKRGDVFTDSSVTYTLVDVYDNGTNLRAQFDKQYTGSGISTNLTIGRYPANVFSTSNIKLNRFINTGSFQTTQAASATVLTDSDLGRGAWPGFILIIHTGTAAGTYTIDNATTMATGALTLSTGLLGAVAVGDQWSVVNSIGGALDFAGSAWGSTLYCPTFNGNDFSAIASGFPTTNFPYFVNIINGPNQGVYEVIQFTSANEVQINGTLVTSGESILPANTTFNAAHVAGSTVITEPGTPYASVLAGDTLIINSGGTLSYYYIASTTSSALTLSQPLVDSVIPGSETYTIVRDNVNPFIITSLQQPWEVDSVPVLNNRPAEGLAGGAANATNVFESLDINFDDAFTGIDPVGYNLFIISGTHARVAPYIIQSQLSATQIAINTGTTAYDANFNSSGFINSTSPANSEQWYISKQVPIKSNITYTINENYDYYGNTFFNLPILGIQNIFTIDPTTGDVSSSPLVQGSDYTLEVVNIGTRYSAQEQVNLVFTNSALIGSALQISYFSDPNVATVNSFCNTRGNKVTCNNLLIKRFESTFVSVTVNVTGTITLTTAQDVINSYITTQESVNPIQASDIIQLLYANGVTYVDTSSLLLTAVYLQSDGTMTTTTSPTSVTSSETSTYIPSVITVNISSS
jgi:hypothetical protein